MSLLTLILTLAVIGLLMGLLNKFGGAYIDRWYLTLINVVVLVAVILWLLGAFGVLPMASSIPVPRVR